MIIEVIVGVSPQRRKVACTSFESHNASFLLSTALQCIIFSPPPLLCPWYGRSRRSSHLSETQMPRTFAPGPQRSFGRGSDSTPARELTFASHLVQNCFNWSKNGKKLTCSYNSPIDLISRTSKSCFRNVHCIGIATTWSGSRTCGGTSVDLRTFFPCWIKRKILNYCQVHWSR